MSDLRQAAQQALERLEACVCPPSVHHDIINPLRAALKQQAEPIGWLDGNDKLAEFMHRDLKADHDKRGSATPREFTVPVYTAQPQRKPPTCAWSPEDVDTMPDTYRSACGELWSFIDGGPKDNRVRYCHGCGGKVVEASSGIQELKP